MNGDLLAVAASFAILLGLISMVGLVVRKRKQPLDVQAFTVKWQAAQKLCSKKETWPLAVINADKLLDEVLKKCHYKGKSMGERLASAQRDIDNNDGVWYGHKLRNRLVHEDDVKLTQKDVQKALMGIREAMRDLGALK
jgi:hypothetical protein